MKFSTLAKALAVMAFAFFSFSSANAQSPSEQFGVGINLQSGVFGGSVAYAMTPALHIGTQFGLQIGSVTPYEGASSVSVTNLLFAPYGKFILAGSKEFKPFIMGQIAIGSTSSGATVSDNRFIIAGGAEYFMSKNFGAWGSFRVLDIGFGDQKSTFFGIGNAALGMEWFFH